MRLPNHHFDTKVLFFAVRLRSHATLSGASALTQAFFRQTQMHLILYTKHEWKQKLKFKLQAYSYFKTVKYNWHNGKHCMNVLFSQVPVQINEGIVCFFLTHRWWTICTNPHIYVFFFYLHISHDVPSNILIPLCYMSYINWTSLHVVSLLIRFAYTYCTHSLSDANRTDSDDRSAASTVCHLCSPSACYVELQNNWCLTFSLSNIKDSLQWSGAKEAP